MVWFALFSYLCILKGLKHSFQKKYVKCNTKTNVCTAYWTQRQWADLQHKKVKVNTGSKHVGYVEGSGLLLHFTSIQSMKNKTPQ